MAKSGKLQTVIYRISAVLVKAKFFSNLVEHKAAPFVVLAFLALLDGSKFRVS